MNENYNPTKIEKKWISIWNREPKICFKKIDSNNTYSTFMPPPNVTGIITIGHVLNSVIQDILIRKAEQDGKKVLWIPGFDHAGIATQIKFKEVLEKKKDFKTLRNKSLFISKCKTWSLKNQEVIINQLTKLGISCDWKKKRYTIDKDYSKFVKLSFLKLWEDGKIYRGKKIINWCSISKTAISDEEIISKKVEKPLYIIKYKILISKKKYLEVATTKPELIMADTALAVNPRDKRYKDLIGKEVINPISKDKIPIISDSSVNQKFGTGVLKITPAHSKTDFEIWERNKNKIGIINIIRKDGTLNKLAGKKFLGLNQNQAKKLVIKILTEKNLVSKINYKHKSNVYFLNRLNSKIDFIISQQWFLKYPMVKDSIKVVLKNYINFIPPHFKKIYFHWLNNIKDWCISRQIWWGHQIPVWYKKGFDKNNFKNWKVSIKKPSDKKNDWEQEQNTLDTWFSSWLWPLSILNLIKFSKGKNKKLKIKINKKNIWYPFNVVVTGPDIISFWISRMIIASLFFLKNKIKNHNHYEDIKDNIPFKNVYLTGIIRDKNGNKISKSLNNSPDLKNLMSIYGSDSIRIGVVGTSFPGKDFIFDEKNIKDGNRICLKLWNACIFREKTYYKNKLNKNIKRIRKFKDIINDIDSNYIDEFDIDVINKLIKFLSKFELMVKQFSFKNAIQSFTIFLRKIYCDQYIEVSKIKIKKYKKRIRTYLAIQDLCIRYILFYLHPFIPFLTDHLWNKLKYSNTIIKNYRIENKKKLKILLIKKGFIFKKDKIKNINKIVKIFKDFSKQTRVFLRNKKEQGITKKLKITLNINKKIQKIFKKTIFNIKYYVKIFLKCSGILLFTIHIVYNDQIKLKVSNFSKKILLLVGVLEIQKNTLKKIDFKNLIKKKQTKFRIQKIRNLIKNKKNLIRDKNFIKKAPIKIQKKTLKLLKNLKKEEKRIKFHYKF
jgi:valyl-tRNA synthetase